MSRDNMFEDDVWEPTRSYDDFDDSLIKEARGTFSRFNLSLFFYLIISYAAVFTINAVIVAVFKFAAWDSAPLESSIYEILVSTLPMYVISFPILFLMVMKMPTRKREKRKLPFSELFYIFLVAEAFLVIGNLIGQSFTSTIEMLLGIEQDNAVADLVENTPIWLVFIVVAILAPIVEELIFRKLMIDRLSRYGDTVAILTSGIAFGLFHGNFSQFFYAAFLGIIFGYVYAKSGKIKYTIVYHMLVNFFGSVVTIPLLKYYDVLEEVLMSASLPETEEGMQEFLIALLAFGSYSMLQYAMVIAGVIIFIVAVKRRRIELDRMPEVRIPRRRLKDVILRNPGTILFLVISILSFLGSILENLLVNL